MEQDNQLLQNFSDTEKVAYLSAIASIATADRAATEDEVEFLEALADSADLSPAQEQQVIQAASDASNANLKHHLDNLKNSQLRYSLLADMISFAKADGQYTAEEQNKVQQIASYLNINQSQFNALNQFVDKADQAQKQGQDVTSSGFVESSGIGSTLSNLGISKDFMKGALVVMGPILLSRMMSGRGRRRGGMMGGGMMGGGMGGIGGGLLGGLLGGMASRGSIGGGGMMGGGMSGMGGLGSLFSVLGGSNRRYSNYGRSGGGLSSVLGGLLGGGRSGGLF